VAVHKEQKNRQTDGFGFIYIKPVVLWYGDGVGNTGKDKSSIFTTKKLQKRERTHKDHESDKLCVGAFSALASDDVPLLRCADDHLCRHYLLLVQLVITG